MRRIIDKEAIKKRRDKVLDYLSTPGFGNNTLYQSIIDKKEYEEYLKNIWNKYLDLSYLLKEWEIQSLNSLRHEALSTTTSLENS